MEGYARWFHVSLGVGARQGIEENLYVKPLLQRVILPFGQKVK
jgi:hypothetical protein